jgi:hypothetical protein
LDNWIKKTSFIQVFDSIVQVFLLLFQNHETQCKYKPIQCQHYGCEEKYSADDIESHLRTCKYRPVKCNHCEETIPYFQQAVSVDCIWLYIDQVWLYCPSVIVYYQSLTIYSVYYQNLKILSQVFAVYCPCLYAYYQN